MKFRCLSDMQTTSNCYAYSTMNFKTQQLHIFFVCRPSNRICLRIADIEILKKLWYTFYEASFIRSIEMASIRDVAREAGVASCTVSRVLNGTANVAPETQKK